MDMHKLIESRLDQIYEQQDRLSEAWSPYINAVNKYLQETQNRSMNDHERRNVAQCLENALVDSGLRSRSKLFEATTEDNISFLGVQLPVIAALLPTLVLNDVSIVQALDRRTGAVFYLDVQYASNKGAISSGSSMISPTTGHNRTLSGRMYASTIVEQEAIANSSSITGPNTITYNVAYRPGVNVALPWPYNTAGGTTIIKDGSGCNVADDSAVAATITGSNGITGTITAAGLLTLTVAAGSSTDSSGLTVTYQYQYDLPYTECEDDETACRTLTGVPQVDVNIEQEVIQAIDFPLRSSFSLGAAIDLKKAHGLGKSGPSYSDVRRKAA